MISNACPENKALVILHRPPQGTNVFELKANANIPESALLLLISLIHLQLAFMTSYILLI